MACLGIVCFSLLVRFVIMLASQLQPPQKNILKHDTLVFICYVLYTLFSRVTIKLCTVHRYCIFFKKCSNLPDWRKVCLMLVTIIVLTRMSSFQNIYIGVSKNNGTPIINHPFGVPLFFWKHPFGISFELCYLTQKRHYPP